VSQCSDERNIKWTDTNAEGFQQHGSLRRSGRKQGRNAFELPIAASTVAFQLRNIFVHWCIGFWQTGGLAVIYLDEILHQRVPWQPL